MEFRLLWIPIKYRHVTNTYSLFNKTHGYIWLFNMQWHGMVCCLFRGIESSFWCIIICFLEGKKVLVLGLSEDIVSWNGPVSTAFVGVVLSTFEGFLFSVLWICPVTESFYFLVTGSVFNSKPVIILLLLLQELCFLTYWSDYLVFSGSSMLFLLSVKYHSCCRSSTFLLLGSNLYLFCDHWTVPYSF